MGSNVLAEPRLIVNTPIEAVQQSIVLWNHVAVSDMDKWEAAMVVFPGVDVLHYCPCCEYTHKQLKMAIPTARDLGAGCIAHCPISEGAYFGCERAQGHPYKDYRREHTQANAAAMVVYLQDTLTRLKGEQVIDTLEGLERFTEEALDMPGR